jgi:23S rRNA pseudouridine1911/1915/1917 synthase
VGDSAYRGARPALPAPRPFLHATVLAFQHPVSGAVMRFEEPLPDDLAALLATL